MWFIYLILYGRNVAWVEMIYIKKTHLLKTVLKLYLYQVFLQFLRTFNRCGYFITMLAYGVRLMSVIVEKISLCPFSIIKVSLYQIN